MGDGGGSEKTTDCPRVVRPGSCLVGLLPIKDERSSFHVVIFLSLQLGSSYVWCQKFG